MKSPFRAFLIIVILCIVCSGCSIPRRGIMGDNIYVSTQSPNIKISVNHDFLYQEGNFGEWEHQFFDNENRKLTYIHHTLHRPNENIIDYFDNPEHWIYVTSSDAIELKRFTMEIYENKWYVQDYASHSSTASCHMVRKLSTFTSRHDLLHILYAWEIPPYKCSTWLTVDSLNDSQQEFVEQFRKGFREDLIIERYIEK